MIIIGGKIFFPPHDDGRVADRTQSIEVGDVKFTPSHDMTDEQVGKAVTRIMRILGKLGTDGE